MNEKLIEDFMAKGCKSRRNAAVCLQVYLDLCEVKRYWDVKCSYSEECETLYITCKRSKSSPISVYIPCYISDKLSFERMQKLLSLAANDDQEINLAMVSSDSTVVIYQIQEGLSEPIPENQETTREEKREQLDIVLRKHKKLLEQSALYNVAITLPKSSQSKEKKKEETSNKVT